MSNDCRGTRGLIANVMLAACLFLFLVGPLRAQPAPAPADPVDPDGCLGCHGDPSVTRGAPVEGRPASVYIDAAKLVVSNHAAVGCSDCHAESFKEYPHAPAAAPRCLDCHTDNDPGPEGVAFADIAADFKRSVHFERNPSAFDCVQCHDPHSFRRWKQITTADIAVHNGVCLRCHASAAEFGRLAHRPPPDLDRAHQWLPHRDLHWRQVRCLDCHSSYEPPIGSHHLLPATRAVRECVSCHSANSILKLKLYRHRRREETQRLGFMNAMIVNDAYVIGATRNRFVDLTGAFVVGSAVLGVALHAAWRRRRRAPRSPRVES
jgi:predicted CXXCH cytochrome family protein